MQRLCWECRFVAAIRDYNVVYLYTDRQQEDDNKTWGSSILRCVHAMKMVNIKSTATPYMNRAQRIPSNACVE